MSDLTITGPQGPVPVHLVTPAGDGPWPGVVVLHDALGMTPDLRAQARWLADAGYLAAAPDLLSWGSRFRCIRTVIADVSRGEGRSFDEIEAVRSWLAARPDCTGKIGVIGFCMGGGFALVLAPRGGFDAAGVNYGSARRSAYTPEFLAGSCPIVASFGRRDVSLRGAAARLGAALTTAGVEHDVKEYPDANHSFMNDHDPADMPLLFRGTARLGMRFHEPSAVDARRRIVEFFDRQLA